MTIADELKLNREIKRLLLVSALCHDIGKIGIPDAILKKASRLSSEEYDEMKLHPTLGAEIVTHMPNAHRFISGVKHHHEKWDGTGYPDGLKGDEISLLVRITTVADIFDALTTDRPYRPRYSFEEAFSKLRQMKNEVDQTVVEALNTAIRS